jgi:hypothetical protein
MCEKTKVFQFSIQPSLVERVKIMGNGKFAAGLFFALNELDRLQGTTTKLESVVLAPKGGSKPARQEDPLHPGDTYQAKAKRAREAHANSPETRRAKYRPQIERYLKECYSRYGGVVDEATEYTPYELSKDGMTPIYGTPIKIMDYITEEERDEWVEAGRIHALGDKERNTVCYRSDQYRPQARTQTKQLTPEALLGYGFKRTPPDMSDEAIEAINAEWAPGGEHYGDDPIREMEK